MDWNRRWLNAGLHVRLVALILFAFAPIFGLTVYNALEQRAAAERDALNTTLGLARLAAAELQHVISATHQQLRSLTQLPVVRRPAWRELCVQTLGNILKQHAQYINVGVVAPDGDVRCSAVPPKQRVNLGDRPYIRRAFEQHEFSSSYQVGRITGKPTLSIAYPILDDAGRAEGVVFIAHNLVVLFDELIRNVSLPAGATLTVINSEGTILARHPDARAWVGKSLPETQLVRTIVAQREGTAELVGLDGAENFHTFLPLLAVPDINIYVSVGIPREVVLAPVNRAFGYSLLSITVIAVLATIAALLGSRALVLRPVNALIQAIGRFGRGDLNARTRLPHTAGEIGLLARRFDEMADNLEHSGRELRRVNRALRILSAGNRAMLRANNEQALLDEMCRAIVEEGGYGVALALYRRDDEASTLWPMAASGYPGGLEALRKLRISWADDNYGRGSAGIAVRTGQMQLTRNSLSDPNYAVWHAIAPVYPSDVSMPLRVQGDIIGVLAICANEPNAFQPDELKLLEESANDLCFGIETLRTRAAHEQARDTIRRMSHYDTLTGLPNETLFAESLIEAIRETERRNEPLAILEIDVNRLREINDALGFAQGDELLRLFAARLKDALGENTLVARLRGDEFAALLPRTGAGAAEEIARHVAKSLATPYRVAEIPLDVPSHIGIALFPEHGATPHELFRHVDMAMQQAVKKGLGYALYDPRSDADRPRRLAMAGELRRAIDNGDLLLYLQPKVEIATGRVAGAEGLVRWRHAERGLIPPGEFIELAEHTGLIKPLTEWVIETALRQGHAWRRRGFAMPIAVNLSARNLREPELVERIRRLRAACGGELELEITESAIMEDAGYALGVLRQLNDDGIPLHIDDFGTGYSSLSYLQKLPVDTVKIDRSFVTGIVTDKDSALIVRSTIDLAHDLGLKVVAEGVENIETWKNLASLGCDVAQGFMLSKPMPAEDFIVWVSQFQAPPPPG